MPELLQVAFASSEISPFARSGGLGEVLGSLPAALERQGLRSCLIMPAYRCVMRSGLALEDTGIDFTVPIAGKKEAGSIFKTQAGSDIPVYLIRADKYFDRDGLYGDGRIDYPDNAERFTFFSRAVLEILRVNPPQILHVHDWQTALAAVFLKLQPSVYPELSSVKTVFTIHNLGYQGMFPPSVWPLLALKPDFFTPRYLEFWGKINFLKGGIALADAVTTVSPTYAREVLTAEQGFGMEGVLRERTASLTGILNGIDYDSWNPEADPFINRKYNLSSLSGKKICKADLQRGFCLPENPDVFLLGMVTRLTGQKGMDLLEKTLEVILLRDVQFVLLGTGEKKYEGFLSRAAMKYPGKVGIRFDYNESLSHRIIAGADLLLMPSRYEPCGLTQLQALRYGTIPVVRATGGLADTTEEFDPESGQGNGFVFQPYEGKDFLNAIERALALFRRKKEWTTLMKNAMSADFSWSRSAIEYIDLYNSLTPLDLT